MRDSTGRRSETESYSGRYTGSRAPHGKPRSIAIDATVRTAARNGSVTEDGNLSIKDTDVMEKVYQRRTGVTIVFLVDASGSMGARKRMSAVKGAMLSILTDAYQKWTGSPSYRSEDRVRRSSSHRRTVWNWPNAGWKSCPPVGRPLWPRDWRLPKDY